MPNPQPIALEQMVSAYCQGLFPMADSADDLFLKWYLPKRRGQLSIPDLHIPRSLKKFMRQSEYTITIDQDFEGVIRACAETTPERSQTWINEPIITLFLQAHEAGLAHSVEYRLNGELKGGLYGLALGGIFCGESMFSRAENASKTALVHLCARLHKGGFKTLDTQFTNEHLEQFGVTEISNEDYQERLRAHLPLQTDFLLEGITEEEILQDYL